MTNEEIVKALRRCEFGEPCDLCPVVSDQNCVNVMHKCAADLIERLTAENAEIRVQRQQAAAGADRLSVFERIAQYFRRRHSHDK